MQGRAEPDRGTVPPRARGVYGGVYGVPVSLALIGRFVLDVPVLRDDRQVDQLGHLEAARDASSTSRSAELLPRPVPDINQAAFRPYASVARSTASPSYIGVRTVAATHEPDAARTACVADWRRVQASFMELGPSDKR